MTSGAPVYVKRIINAPIERVFQAWTDPEELKRWHAPEPEGILAAVSENHVGGKRSLTLIIDGRTYHIAGVYHEFDPPYKLIYSWEDPSAPTNSITTVLFRQISENETELEVSYTNPPNGTVQDGLRIILGHLQHYLAA
ncbi:MAG TPA: SRPBCC domain-containing protein [Candidatus Saccharimonadia bacterium]|nr:SRPBCC domain-containing protein [Candidatus Saccharimonadia bacterium]